MLVRIFDVIGSDDSMLQKFCSDPYIIIRSEKIFFDSKDCIFNIVIYYEVSPEPLDVRTCISVLSSSASDIVKMNDIMSDERNFVSARTEFCAKGGGPVFFVVIYCHKIPEAQMIEFELENDYNEGGVLF